MSERSGQLSDSALTDLRLIRKLSPVVLNLTNAVAMDLTANALLAIGASPVMAHAPEEVPELVAKAHSLVVNIGTLDPLSVEAMKLALTSAERHGKPTVLDPVGSGATSYRTQTARRLMDNHLIHAVRGNASEVLSLFRDEWQSRGVDSSLSSEDIVDLIGQESRGRNEVFVMSGATDFIFHGPKQRISLRGGDPMMARVTAIGCTASAILGAFLAVSPSAFDAAVHTMSVMNLAGERARVGANGPGSFRVRFLDELFRIGEGR